MRNCVTPNIVASVRRLRLLMLDVDGVLSNGILHYADNQSEAKGFHTLDGHGIKSLATLGIRCAIVTARSSPVVSRRGQELGIARVIQSAQDKLETMLALVQEYNLALSECAHMGDDVADLTAMRAGGIAFSVPDAPLIVREAAHYVTRVRGGAGAVREVCDLLSRIRRRN